MFCMKRWRHMQKLRFVVLIINQFFFFFAGVEIAAVAANTRREDQDTGSANVKP